jgi:hypothetical protein
VRFFARKVHVKSENNLNILALPIVKIVLPFKLLKGIPALIRLKLPPGNVNVYKPVGLPSALGAQPMYGLLRTSFISAG